MKKPKQLSLLPAPQKQFGGSLLKGHAKAQRPLATKTPVHLVLKSRFVFGEKSMLHPQHARFVRECIRLQAKKNGLKIYQFVNVGNHLHLVVRIHNRNKYKVFIRAIAGLIARRVLGRERGKAGAQAKSRASFWLQRPFSRIASWGADYKGLVEYMLKNQRQAQRGSRWLASKVLGFDVEGLSYRNSA